MGLYVYCMVGYVVSVSICIYRAYNSMGVELYETEEGRVSPIFGLGTLPV